MTNTTQIERNFGIWVALKVLLKHELINQETFDKIVKHELREQIRFFLTKTDRERSYFMDEYQLNTRHSFRHLKIRCNGMKILRSVFQIGKS